MPRLLPNLAALALLLAAPALAQDVSGLWKVEGRLPGGKAYAGHTVVSYAGPGRYRVKLEAKRPDGRAVRLYGLARQEGDQLEVRYRAGAGLATVITGATQGVIVGKYKVAGDGASFEGPLTTAGVSAGQAKYTKQAAPQVTLTPAAAQAEVGATVSLTLKGPAELLPLVTVLGPGRLLVTGTGGERRVRVEELAAGAHELTAHLGTENGALLAQATITIVDAAAPVSVLDEVLAEVERLSAQEPIVIFDLDDTLFETRTRSSTIVREWGQQNGNQILAACKYEHVAFGIEDTLRAAGLPEAEVTGDVGKAVRRFWSPRFFNGSYFKVDTPLPGAVAYVNRLAEAGARIMYVSGRPESGRQPSLEALAAHGFPTGPGTQLFVKPSVPPGAPKLETHAWKGKVAREDLAPLGPIVAAFDNEPANCNAFREALPTSGRVIFLDTLYDPQGPQIAERVTRIEGTYEE